MYVLSSGRQKEPSDACVILQIMWFAEFVSSAKTDDRMSLLPIFCYELFHICFVSCKLRWSGKTKIVSLLSWYSLISLLGKITCHFVKTNSMIYLLPLFSLSLSSLSLSFHLSFSIFRLFTHPWHSHQQSHKRSLVIQTCTSEVCHESALMKIYTISANSKRFHSFHSVHYWGSWGEWQSRLGFYQLMKTKECWKCSFSVVLCC